MTSAELIKRLKAAGWIERSVRGSHHIYVHPVKGGHITVPHPKKDLGVGLVRAILKQAGGRPEIGVTMKFVIGLEPGTRKTAWGVVVPDLPGCFSAGGTIDEAVENAREAIALFCEVLAEDGKEIPVPSSLAEHQANPAYKGWVWAVVDAPVERYFGPAEKINITVPGRILDRIDAFAKEHNESRSGFLVRAATEAMVRK